jgi:hypothetical protein
MILTGENRRIRIKTMSRCRLSTINHTWTVLGANLGLHKVRLATNSVRYDAAPAIKKQQD